MVLRSAARGKGAASRERGAHPTRIRRRCVPLELMLAALLFQFAGLPQRAGAKVPVAPDVLVVVLDDVGEVDLTGLPLPNLSDLASNGMRMRAAYANPTCDRTRRSVLFGQWWVERSGNSCGALNGDEPLLSQTSLAEIVPAVRSGLAGKWHLGADPTGGPWECAPLVHGFDAWIGGMPGNVAECGGTDYDLWTRVDACGSALSSQYEPEATSAALSSWWTGTNGTRLGVLSLNLAHAPFHVPPAHLLPSGYPTPTNQRQRYEAMIVAYDTLLGQVLAGLNPQNTLVIVLGDNGTPPNAGGGPKSKGTVFERGIHVPMICAASWIQPGESSALVHAVDVYATVADYYGKAALPTDGLSLRPLLEGQPFAGHDYVLCGNSDEVCARSASRKLRRLASGLEEFYDLALDPGENVNRIGSPAYAADVAAHRAWLDAHLP